MFFYFRVNKHSVHFLITRGNFPKLILHGSRCNEGSKVDNKQLQSTDNLLLAGW